MKKRIFIALTVAGLAAHQGALRADFKAAVRRCLRSPDARGFPDVESCVEDNAGRNKGNVLATARGVCELDARGLGFTRGKGYKTEGEAIDGCINWASESDINPPRRRRYRRSYYDDGRYYRRGYGYGYGYGPHFGFSIGGHHRGFGRHGGFGRHHGGFGGFGRHHGGHH